MTDDELLDGIEGCTLAATRFGHAEHVRLAWIVLGREEPARALARIATAIRRYATSLGHPDQYHATITWAFVALVAERRERTGPGAPWAAFRDDNPDLFDAAVLGRYYDGDTLGSELARRTFVLPRP